MVKDPLSLLDSLVVAISGFVIVFMMLAALWGIIIVISKIMGSMSKPVPAVAAASVDTQQASAPAVSAAASTAPEEELPIVPLVPEIELGKGVTEAEAACIMAIVCYETGIPFNELIFKSIKLKQGGKIK